MAGNYADGSWIILSNNNLTRLDSNVFKPLLEQLRLYGRAPFAALRLDNSKISIIFFFKHFFFKPMQKS
jgi:hypothetical protein